LEEDGTAPPARQAADLLQLSRIGYRTFFFKPAALAVALQEAIAGR
jgi:hypothetical protein